MKNFPVLVIMSFLFFSACTKDKGQIPVPAKEKISDCDSGSIISYSATIVPIINRSCGTNSGGCHSNTSSFGDLTTYPGVKVHLPTMMLHAVLWDDPINYQPMPLVGQKLSDCELAKIRNWISQGYANN